jgi:hypothetical protein
MVGAAVVLVSLNQSFEQQEEDEAGQREESHCKRSETGSAGSGLQVQQGAAEQGPGRERHEGSDQVPDGGRRQEQGQRTAQREGGHDRARGQDMPEE